MKGAAGILLFIWTLVLTQPAFALFGGKSAYGECSKTVASEPACSKSKTAGGSTCSKKKAVRKPCSKKKADTPSKSDGKDNCKSDGCNPTLGCSSGNFYVHHHAQISLPSGIEQKQKAILIDDNRIVNNMSECWHPPEA